MTNKPTAISAASIVQHDVASIAQKEPSNSNVVEQDKVEAEWLAGYLWDVTFELLKSTRRSGKKIQQGDDPDRVVSKVVLLEVANYAIRDMRRIDDEQDNATSTTKLFAYLGFWFSRLKPISADLFILDEEENEMPLVDINEQIVPSLILRMMRELIEVDPELAPERWKECDVTACKDKGLGTCFFRRYEAHLLANKNRHLRYLNYSLRFRPVGPYFVVDSIDQGITMSCDAQRIPL